MTVLCRMAARCASDNLVALREADPDVPPELHNRDADNWRPLLALADLAGGDWPELARRTARLLIQEDGTGEDSAGAMLLADIQGIFQELGSDRIATVVLLHDLHGMEDRPWPEWRRGQPLTPRALARLLKPFGICPDSIRLQNTVAKGYQLEQFTDAFERYVGGSATPERLRSGTV